MTYTILIIILILIPILYVMIMSYLSANRAYKTMPYSYKTGMYIDLKTKKLIGTRTPVYRDPKTNITYLGKTERYD